MKINPRGIGAALGSYRIAQGLGLALGSSIGGFLIDRFGIAGSYATLGGILALLVLFAFTIKEQKVQKEQKFVEKPTATVGVNTSSPITNTGK